LHQEASAGPVAGEGRKKSLHITPFNRVSANVNRNETFKTVISRFDFWGIGLKVDHPALQPDCDRMRPVVRSEDRKDLRCVAFDGPLGCRQPGGDFFIRVPLCDQFENLQFARDQIFSPGMLGQFCRYLRRNSLLSGVNGSDDIQQLAIWKKPTRARPQRPNHLHVIRTRRQDDDLTVAPKNGAIMAGRKGPAMWLRYGHIDPI
jgi:hypothetical protein